MAAVMKTSGLAGLLTGAVALGIADLTAAVTGPDGAPVTAVGETAINLTPVPVKEFAIAHFGTHDKAALVTGIVMLLAAFAVLIGVLAVRRLAYGLAALAVFAAIGVAAAVSQGGGLNVVPTLAGAVVAGVTLVLMVRAIRGAGPREGTGTAGGPGGKGLERRRFLIVGAGAAALGVAAGGWVTRCWAGSASPRPGRRSGCPGGRPGAAVPAGTDLRIPGLTPFMTSNASFYRVDTNLVLPQVPPETWTLRIDGMVDRPVEFTFTELLKMPLTDADITLVCVSNQVGGTYNGNARWLGVPLAGLLRRAGVRPGADQVLSAATDGMTISTPVAAIMDGRNALLAVGMNGQPLPVAHGFPARMIVPGLYGYVSATKWVTKLTLTTFARQKAYWTQRGYSARAPVKTESRIDVPKPLSQVKAGRVTVAGVAWAPAKGIAKVEVSADNGPWRQATLAASGGIDTWRQWMWGWDARPGLHNLRVRATDNSGATQTPQRAYPVPNGASGWDSVVVTVM